MKLLILIISILASITHTYSDELKIYVIKPPRGRVNWKNPSALAMSTFINSTGHDYAPIGHFAVEVNCSNKNRYGVNRILTGMERKSKAESRKIVLSKKLGFGSLLWSFEGALQSKDVSLHDILQGLKQKRMKVIKVPTSKARCDQMLDFVEQWIDNGSYRVYGGMKNVSSGEGAGCADFAMELFRIATHQERKDWSVHINIPTKLIGDGAQKQVKFTKLLTRFKWATEDEESFYYTIPDTNITLDWLKPRMKKRQLEYVYTEHLKDVDNIEDLLAHDALKSFDFSYDKTISNLELWEKIRLDKNVY